MKLFKIIPIVVLLFFIILFSIFDRKILTSTALESLDYVLTSETESKKQKTYSNQLTYSVAEPTDTTASIETTIPTETTILQQAKRRLLIDKLISETASKNQTTPVKANQPTYTIEYQLAVINNGGYVPQSDITVIRFRYLLETLERKTIHSREQISDMSVKGITLLREKYGRYVSLLQFMEVVNSSIPEGENADYALEACVCVQLLKM